MKGGVLDRRILLAFAGVVLLAGSNIVAVRFSNRELDPFWGAGLRFLGASVILWALVARGRYPLPRGRALGGAFVYGDPQLPHRVRVLLLGIPGGTRRTRRHDHGLRPVADGHVRRGPSAGTRSGSAASSARWSR